MQKKDYLPLSSRIVLSAFFYRLVCAVIYIPELFPAYRSFKFVLCALLAGTAQHSSSSLVPSTYKVFCLPSARTSSLSTARLIYHQNSLCLSLSSTRHTLAPFSALYLFAQLFGLNWFSLAHARNLFTNSYLSLYSPYC
jgi:hypothetical protein